MNWRRNSIYLLIGAALTAWYYFYEIRGSELRTEAELEAARVMPGLEPARLQRIRISRLAETPPDMETQDTHPYLLEFYRSDGEWYLQKPVIANCDQDIAEALAGNLVKIRRGRLIVSNPESLEPYGLGTPGFIIDLSYDGTETQIRLGDENPSGDAFYASFGDNPDIYLVDISLKTSLIRKALEFRKREVMDTSRDSINGVTVEFPKDALTLVFKRTNQEWTVREEKASQGHGSPEVGKESPADMSRIQEMLGVLTARSIDDFIDQPADADQYGLREPTIRIRAVPDDGTLSVIDIGEHSDPGGKSRYARCNESGPVLILKNDFYDVFKPDYFYYRSKTVCDMNRDVIDRIVIESPKASIELVRDSGGAWTMIKPPDVKTDSLAAGSYLSSLTYLRATGVKRPDERFGDTIAVIKLFSANAPDTPITLLEIGGKPSDDVGRWIKTKESEDVFRISDSDADALMPDTFHFKDKTLMHVEKSDVRKIRVTRAGHSIEFEPDASSWRLTDTGGGEFSQDVAENIYWTIHALDMDAELQVNANPSESGLLARYGLDEPNITVQITLLDGQSVSLLFGHSERGQIAVWKENEPVIGAVEESRLEPLTALSWTSSKP
ncbi:DUF4340 domain-containing protein [bacterium]|nr:DUF4340 domain-containing protein [candidate division CSSED10-310 bacterium]